MRGLAAFTGTPQNVSHYYIASMINVTASGGSSIEGTTITMPTRSGKPPIASVDIEVSNQSTSTGVNVSRGELRAKVKDQSALDGLSVGGKVAKEPSGWRWFVEKILVPHSVAIIGGSFALLAAYFAWWLLHRR